MTREEREKAIEYFKFRRKIFCDDFLKIYPENSIAYQATLIEKSFHDMAIKALEQEPCEDCISRHAVVELVEGWWIGHTKEDDLSTEIQKLPSVNPQKIGHWIIEKWNNKEHYSCSSCQHVVDYEPCYHYCPYCGAEMVEPQESEDAE